MGPAMRGTGRGPPWCWHLWPGPARWGWCRGADRALPSRVLCLPAGKWSPTPETDCCNSPNCMDFLKKQLNGRKYWKFRVSKNSTRCITCQPRQTLYSNRASSCASSYTHVLADVGVNNKFSSLKIPFLVKALSAPVCQPPKAPYSVTVASRQTPTLPAQQP